MANFLRVVTPQKLWSGNREIFKTTFSRDFIILWLLQTYRKRRKEYPILLQKPEYAHLKILHFYSPQLAQEWLLNLKD